jgi:hypothetical protein
LVIVAATGEGIVRGRAFGAAVPKKAGFDEVLRGVKYWLAKPQTP